jgi:hypothetical protein
MVIAGTCKKHLRKKIQSGGLLINLQKSSVMKCWSYKILVFLSVILLADGCQKDYILSNGQKLLFELSYINNAWTYQHKGFIIDNEGNILTYDNPDKWNFPDDDRLLTEEQVDENLSMCNTSGEKISATELRKFTNYIDNIASSKVTAPKNRGADMGSRGYYCYLFSEATSTYKEFIIKMEGDWECENLNFYSKRIADWMNDIQKNLPEEDL